MVNKKIADLLEDICRLSDELRDKDALLARSMEVAFDADLSHVIIHLGTNDTVRRQSELRKNYFKDLFNLLKSCCKSVFITGPIPTLSPGVERFSRLISLSTWLWHICTAQNLNFIDNFNLFWNCLGFYLHDRLHPSTLGNSVLTANILHAVQSTPTD
uniref:SGNH hydrolase-type esterase domain-containing protein n=1 Tax=Acanthochromis polyacanthus TaxID=80966 RepID=A0A3Q1G235_9TELE